jgi:hypothetical protein
MTFLIRWIIDKGLPDSIFTERVEGTDEAKVVEECKNRLDEVRLQHADRPPNGFWVLSEDGVVLRQIVDRTKPV